MDSDDEIRIVYRADDLRALYRACRRCRRNAVLLALLPIVVGLFSYREGTQGLGLFFDILPFFLIGLGIVLGIYLISPWNAVRTRRKNGWDAPIAVRLTDQGVATRHPNQDSLFYWSKSHGVVVRGSRLFLFTTPACAIILPRRSFGSDAQFTDWGQRAEALWKSAKSE